MRKVVQLGPNWFQKLEKKYRNWNSLMGAPGLCSGLKSAVAIMNSTKSARKPVACENLRVRLHKVHQSFLEELILQH